MPHFINYVSRVRWRLRKDGAPERRTSRNPRHCKPFRRLARNKVLLNAIGRERRVFVG
ncbi:MAG: hypothetical protein LBM98_11100 [Oscillospiraceae bacterium]|nr:hypothetical protein [Oscillospiraceae bacterium]